MDRRAVTLVALVLALLTTPLTAEAQPARTVWRVGFLGDGPRAERAAISIEPFRDGLRELGYIENQNVLIEERWSEGRSERLLDLATELVRLKVDVIVTHGVRGTKAAQDATRSIPIVMAVSPDPVGTGLVASLARPGGNTTGMTDQVAELGEKEVQIIREVVPQTRRVAILWNESNPGARVTFEQTRAAATKVGLDVATVAIRHPDDLEAAVAKGCPRAAGRPRRHPRRPDREPPGSGCSPRSEAQAAVDLRLDPVRRRRGPTTFQLRINLQTAKVLGLIIPPAVLARADEVIQ